jgi:hypothetical protein
MTALRRHWNFRTANFARKAKARYGTFFRRTSGNVRSFTSRLLRVFSVSVFRACLRLRVCACIFVRVCVCVCVCVIWRENTYGQSHRTRIPFGTLFSLQREKRKSDAWERACPHRDGVAHAKGRSQRSPTWIASRLGESHREYDLFSRRVLKWQRTSTVIRRFLSRLIS